MSLSHRDIAYWIRACDHTIRACGYDGDLDSAGITCHKYDTDSDKWLAWAAHALWRAYKDIEAGDDLLAFRGLLLAKEYKGSRGGFLNAPMTDAILDLRNHCEGFFKS